MTDIEQHFEAQQKLFKQQADEQLNFAAKMRTYKFTAENEFKNTQSKSNQNNNINILLANLNKQEDEIMPKGITKRKDGRYVIRTMYKGKQLIEYAKTKKEAEKIKALQKKQFNLPDSTKGTFFANWINTWFETYKKPFLKPQTAKDTERYCKRLVDELGKIKLKDLTTIFLQQYLNNQPKSRAKEILTNILLAVLKKAYALDYLKKDITLGIVKDKKIKAKRNALTFEQQTILINNIKNNKIEIAVLFYLLTGARKNELIKNIEDINLQNNTIKIHGTKTEKSTLRHVKVSNYFANYLFEYLKANKMPAVETIKKEYYKLCKQNNLPTGLHLLRHTYATNMRVMGIDAKQIQLFLGHEDITTTLNIYTDIYEDITKDNLIKLYNNLLI